MSVKDQAFEVSDAMVAVGVAAHPLLLGGHDAFVAGERLAHLVVVAGLVRHQGCLLSHIGGNDRDDMALGRLVCLRA